jgi:hypothetical protein
VDCTCALPVLVPIAGAGRRGSWGKHDALEYFDVSDSPGVPSGKAIALALAGEGMNLKLVGRSTDKLQKVVVHARQLTVEGAVPA